MNEKYLHLNEMQILFYGINTCQEKLFWRILEVIQPASLIDLHPRKLGIDTIGSNNNENPKPQERQSIPWRAPHCLQLLWWSKILKYRINCNIFSYQYTRDITWKYPFSSSGLAGSMTTSNSRARPGINRRMRSLTAWAWTSGEALGRILANEDKWVPYHNVNNNTVL